MPDTKRTGRVDDTPVLMTVVVVASERLLRRFAVLESRYAVGFVCSQSCRVGQRSIDLSTSLTSGCCDMLGTNFGTAAVTFRGRRGGALL